MSDKPISLRKSSRIKNNENTVKDGKQDSPSTSQSSPIVNRRRSSRTSSIKQRLPSPSPPPSVDDLLPEVFSTRAIRVSEVLPVRYDDDGDPIPYKTVNSESNSQSHPQPILIGKSKALDMSKIRLQAPRHPPERTKNRMFNLPHCPVFYPTEEEWNKNPFEYIEHITDNGNAKDYGICKIVPPENWRPEFSLDSTVCQTILIR